MTSVWVAEPTGKNYHLELTADCRRVHRQGDPGLRSSSERHRDPFALRSFSIATASAPKLVGSRDRDAAAIETPLALGRISSPPPAASSGSTHLNMPDATGLHRGRLEPIVERTAQRSDTVLHRGNRGVARHGPERGDIVLHRGGRQTTRRGSETTGAAGPPPHPCRCRTHARDLEIGRRCRGQPGAASSR